MYVTRCPFDLLISRHFGDYNFYATFLLKNALKLLIINIGYVFHLVHVSVYIGIFTALVRNFA